MTYQDKQRAIVEQLQQQFDAKEYGVDVVEAVSDYESDARVGLTTLSYLPAPITERVALMTDVLRTIGPQHYYYPENALHMTVRNVRVICDPPDFTEEDVQKVVDVVREVAPRHKPVTMTYERFLRSPASVALVAMSDASWGALVGDLRDGFAAAGVPDNKVLLSEEVFFGNTTFVRFTNQPSPAFYDQLENVDFGAFDPFRIEEICVLTTNAALSPTFLKTHARVRLGE